MKITLSKLNTKDLATLAQRTINVSESGNYAVIAGHPLLSDLKLKYADYDAVYAKQIYSGKGVSVAQADKERDNVFSDLKGFLNGYRKLSSVANYQYAEDLYQIFKLFGLELYKLSYSSQTAPFNDMKTKQTAFETLFAEQATANADLRNQKTASGIRKDLERSLKSFLNLITAMKDVTDWKLFYADVNELVKAAKNSDLPNSSQDNNPAQ